MKRILYSLLLLAFTGCGNSFDDRMKVETKEYTERHCPQRLDGYTVLDSAVYDIPSRTYCRYFSVSPEATPALSAHFTALRSGLLDELKNDTQLKECKDEGIIFSYLYRNADTGLEIWHVTFGPDDYGRAE